MHAVSGIMVELIVIIIINGASESKTLCGNRKLWTVLDEYFIRTKRADRLSETMTNSVEQLTVA
jgi:hypothetical protein